MDRTCLCFDLGSRQHVAIEVFDASGRLVAVPWRGTLYPGMQEIEWEGTSAAGDHVATGLYFVRVAAERGRAVGKVIKMR
jgi:flagellar hook assembly protein FlgD